MASNATDEYLVKVEGPGLSIDRPVDSQTAFQIVQLIMTGVVDPAEEPGGNGGQGAGASSQQSLTPGGTGSTANSGKRLTAGEFLSQSGASSNSTKIAAFAGFLAGEGEETFTRERILGLFESARLGKPGNYARDFSKAIEMNLIAESSSQKGSFFLTQSGEQALASQFADAPKSRRPRRPAKKATKKSLAKKAAKATAKPS